MSVSENQLSSKSGFPVFQAESINKIAIDMMTGDLVLPSELPYNKVHVSLLDFNEVMNKPFLKNISEHQDLTSSLKLAPISSRLASGFSSIRSKRPARMYFKDKSLMPPIESPQADLADVLRIPKNIAEYLCKGDVVMGCDDENGIIIPTMRFTIVDRANEELLSENLDNINTEDYMYFMAY